MKIYENEKYIEDIAVVTSLDLPWEKLTGKTVLISGATGMIGTFLIDVLFSKNLGIKVIALGRSVESAKGRFAKHWASENFSFVEHDINNPLTGAGHADFIIHAASNTHPLQYANDPIGTVITNIIGTNNLLNYAADCKAERFMFTSSVEVYGENRGDVEKFDESYCGYIDCNTLRAGYPESKRAGEALCQAFIKQKELDVVISRLSRTYGPTMLASDSKAIAQFIKKGVEGEDIVLKSAGTQFYSYSYVSDAVSAMLTILLIGQKGAAYNVADAASDITLKDLAAIAATHVGKEVIFEIPDAAESAGYSKATTAILASEKLKALGWQPKYSIADGMKRTIDILKTLK